jgi:undecaprenyl-diphosphatase
VNPHLVQLSARVYGWDLAVFRAIHPVVEPFASMLFLARVLAVGPLLVSGGVLLWMFARRDRGMRSTALKAGMTAILALAVNGLIGLLWDRARPFVAGVGHAWMQHAATGSFPSDHLTVQWVVAAVLLVDRRSRVWGLVIAALGLPMAWARIYLGVHYPGDMLGALVIGLLTLLGGHWIYHRRTRRAMQAPASVP